MESIKKDTGRQTLELEDFTPVTDLTQFETELMQRVDDGITVVPLEIMSEDGQRLFAPLTPVLQLEQKLLGARVTVPSMEDVVVGSRLVWLQCQRTRERAVARCRRRPMSAPE